MCVHVHAAYKELAKNNVVGNVFSAQADNESHNKPAKMQWSMIFTREHTCTSYMYVAGNYKFLPIKRNEECNQMNSNLDKGLFLEPP